MTSRIVLDASAALRLVLGLEGANDLAGPLQDCSLVLAPELLCSEVANGLWKYVRARHITADQAVAHYNDAIALTDSLISDREIVVEALAEAGARDHPVYDLLYVVVARRNGASLLTRDKRLARLATTMGVGVASLPG